MEVVGEEAAARQELLAQTRGNAEHGVGLARDGVAQIAAVEVAQTQLVALHALPQQTGHRLVRIDAALVDVVARVAAQQVRNVDPEEGVVLRRRLGRVAERGDGVDAARTADEDLAIVLRVEVDEVLAREHPLAQLESAGEARLLVHGEQRLQRTVLRLGVDQHGQRRGHADAAVGAQRRTLGTHPAVLDARADGVVLEVELHVGVLLAHHIHMGLEDHRGLRLVTRRGGLAHHHVANGVFPVFEPVLLGERHEVLDDLALALRGARHLGDGVEQLPHETGLQSHNF